MTNVIEFKNVSDNEIMAYVTTTKSLKETSEMLSTPMKRVSKVFFESKEWLKISNRLTFILLRFGKGRFKDDVINEYAAKLLSDKNVHQSLDQFCIDYARRNRLIRRDGGPPVVVNVEYIENMKNASCNDSPLVHSMLSNAASIASDKRYLAFLSLKEKWGMSASEIAEVFSVTQFTVHKAFRDGHCFTPKEKNIVTSKRDKKKIVALKNKIRELKEEMKDMIEKNRVQCAPKIMRIKDMERYSIEAALKNFSQEEAARMLGICSKTIRKRLQQYRDLDGDDSQLKE